MGILIKKHKKSITTSKQITIFLDLGENASFYAQSTFGCITRPEKVVVHGKQPAFLHYEQWCP